MIPGSWESREEFLKSVIVSTKGDFMFAGGIFANPKENDHIELEFYEAYEGMTEAFNYGGQGKITDITLHQISQHKGVVYLVFPPNIISQKERIAKFTKVISECGGIAVKLETSGIAHEWNEWFRLINSDNIFDQYCASVVLISDENKYYSCGMHSFELPDAQISRTINVEEAADLINRFNYWRILEKPILEIGHTFSLTSESQYFRLEMTSDKRHQSDDLFYNPKGIWDLEAI